MSNIHPTAVIHAGAQLGKNVQVGAYAVVDEHVVIGDDCEIRPHAILMGHVKMGARNQIGYGAVIGSEPQDLSYRGAMSFVEIGDDNVIREYATIHRGTKDGTTTRVGNNNYLMTGAHIGHNCQVGNHVILVNNVLLGGYVQVGDRAFLGGGTVVHQFVRIGEYVMTRGQSGIGKDVPPFCMAVMVSTVCGLNRVGLKRNGFSQQQRRAIDNAYNVFYWQGLNRTQALEKLKDDPSPDVQKFVSFIAATKRGVCRAVRARETKGRETETE